ncbi:Mur ligase family protein [Sphingomonas rubra]|uniref:UDP-N-acetylmuramate--alanine ligase n=1 Tax=Sphingomonas rubra TaxID=634430 RepID=A0A1I5U3R2_9SPHN|nr:Mur ligase family protein [Sphingomonas rubra]SFP89851.1 UDP-N-acetylmuramate--alanine ligase [Sphingomonas rubra]
MNNAKFFFVGIGGSGMLPLATLLRAGGAEVAGSDRGLDQGRGSAKFDALRAAGIALYPQDGSGVTADATVVASAAVEETVPDIVTANRLGAARTTRATLLAGMFNAAALPIGIAGTSGKSTVTGMIGRILHAAGRDPTVTNGAMMKDFGGAGALVGGGEAFVSEVDESDSAFPLYAPRVAVLNNVTLDHKGLDELRALFAGFVAGAEHVVANVGDAETAALLATLPRERLTTFVVEGDADLRAENLSPEPFAIAFDLVAGEERHRVRLSVPGRHNVSNALAAIGAARAAGVPLAEAARLVQGFTGLRRRYDLVGEANGIAVIDDFGHNPDKVAATLDTLHAHPGRLLVLFQPHGYGPLKQMGAELADTFARRLAPGDVLTVPDPAYFGGTVDRSAGSAAFVARIAAAGAEAYHDADRLLGARRLLAQARTGDRVVVMGARDDTLSLLAADMLRELTQSGGAR